MDLSKFIALLQDRALHFARADKLGDPFEGSSPKRNKEILQEAIVRDRGNKAEEVLEALSRSNKSFIATMNISCWHMNEYESAAMWSLYSKSSDTIGIQTTYHILASILPEQVYAGVVEYIDYNTDTFNANNILMTPRIFQIGPKTQGCSTLNI